MPSLSDIPEVFFRPIHKDALIEWLRVLPVTDDTRRTLLRMWAAQTHVPLSADDWARIAVD